MLILYLLSFCVASCIGKEYIHLLNPVNVGGVATHLEFKVDDENVEMVHLLAMKNQDTLVVKKQVKLSKVKDTYLFKLDQHAAAPGLLKMHLEVSLKDGKKVSQIVKCQMQLNVKLENAKVMGMPMQFGKQQDMDLISAELDDKFKVSYDVKEGNSKDGLVPKQGVVVFRHEASKVETYFMTHGNEQKRNTLNMSLRKASGKLNYQSGKYDVYLIVSDPAYKDNFEWHLGNIELKLGDKPKERLLPLYKQALLHESDTTLKALPEITHMMRAQDSRPPAIVSYIFTGIIVALLFAFLNRAQQLGGNVANFPKGLPAVWASTFLVLVDAIFGLLIWFWLALPMKETLTYLAGLSVLTAFFGHKTLKHAASKKE